MKIMTYEKGIREEANRTTHMYAACIGNAQNLTSLQELQGKNISGVQMPYSADWFRPKYMECTLEQ